MDGYACGSDELSQGIIELISNRILDRTRIQNDTCRNVHGFSPCLRLLVQKECNPPEEHWPCTLQHIQPEQLTVDWYHARLRLILLQFQILDLARYDGLDVKKYVLSHSAKFVQTLIKCEVIGLGYCIQHSIHLFKGLDRSRISTLPVYPRGLRVLGLYENGLKTSAVTSGTTPRNPRTASGNGS